MTKNNEITATTTPSLKIRLKLNTIHAGHVDKVQKPKSSIKLKDKKRKRKSKSKSHKNQKTGMNEKSITASPSSTSPNRLVYWTSERIESTKLILRTVIMAN
ncbi:hypothetical protein [Parasitella parasitica]|uniref:Uncharacterized protein n=1 Tax=Parasitella parasitica TaxID=35722 RepID=A0A0B7NT69_9FUNG|nr:hypothetical protein [Parasitella parasitica]